MDGESDVDRGVEWLLRGSSFGTVCRHVLFYDDLTNCDYKIR